MKDRVVAVEERNVLRQVERVVIVIDLDQIPCVSKLFPIGVSPDAHAGEAKLPKKPCCGIGDAVALGTAFAKRAVSSGGELGLVVVMADGGQRVKDQKLFFVIGQAVGLFADGRDHFFTVLEAKLVFLLRHLVRKLHRRNIVRL